VAKRFTATEKWKDAWFQDLPAKYKLFWLYLLDECDAAGVWKPNIGLAVYQIGESFEQSELIRILKERIQVLDNGYWFIPKFIEFQYGTLSDQSKPHQSVIRILSKHGIQTNCKGIHTIKEKEKEKEEDKEKEKDATKEYLEESFRLFWDKYDKKVDRDKSFKRWVKISNEDHVKIMQHLQKYIPLTPDKTFRKDPSTYLNNQSWENEVVTALPKGQNAPVVYKTPEFKTNNHESLNLIEERLKELDETGTIK
jgi:hypothetical protein